MRLHPNMLSGAVLLLMGACGTPAERCPAGSDGDTSCTQQISQAGRSTQGRSTQGRSTQGRSTQGTGAASSTVDRIQIGGITVEDLQLQGTVLGGSVAGQSIFGMDFIGATVTQKDTDGFVFDSTITNVQIDARDGSGETLLYTLTATNFATGAVENFCLPDPYGGRFAIPFAGSWDDTGGHTDGEGTISFGCTAGVAAKCVRWGYKPWKVVNGRTDYHQACTRMARADYCGDGKSHTEDGTLIDMYDDAGIQVRAPFDLSSPLFFDAAWSAQGAYCMTKDRWLKLSSLVSVTLECKTKFLNLFPLLETSPIDSRDLCSIRRRDVSRSQVRMDNQSGLHINLL